MEKCPICIEFSQEHGNCIMCSKCGNMVCGNCAPSIYAIGCCPICRTSYKTENQEAIDNLEKFLTHDNNIKKKYAQACLVGLYYETKQYVKARQIATHVSMKEFPGVASIMGDLYLGGFGGTKDYSKAKKIYLSSIHVPGSMSSLGDIYINGWGVRKNISYGKLLKKLSGRIFSDTTTYHCRTGEKINH